MDIEGFPYESIFLEDFPCQEKSSAGFSEACAFANEGHAGWVNRRSSLMEWLAITMAISQQL